MAFGVTRDPYSRQIMANNAASGNNRYGLAASYTATTGAVDKTGYADRDARRRARQAEIIRRLRMQSQMPMGTPLGGQ